MKWMAIVVLIWAASPNSPPPVIRVAVETETLCKEAVKTLARDLGRDAAKALERGKAAPEKSSEELARKHNLVLTSCVQIAN